MKTNQDDKKLQANIEAHRKFWADVAKSRGWYAEPFYIQVWIDASGAIIDSVSHRELTEDIIDAVEP